MDIAAMLLGLLLPVLGLLQLVLATPAPYDYLWAVESVLSKILCYYDESPNVTVGLLDQTMSPWW